MSVGLGVAGLGWLGESLIKDVPRVGGLSVVAVQDVVAERAAQVGATYAVGWSGGRFQDLLRVPEVDAVLICTPNAFHAHQAQMALAAGKHVLVQKPLALSLRDAEAAIAAAGRARRLLFVDYTYRFLETMRALRETISGPITSIRAAFHNIYGPGAEKTWFFDPKLSGGGALTDLGVHLLDLAFWLAQPADVRLRSVALSGDGPVESAAQLTVGLDEVGFELDVSWNAPRPQTEIWLEVVCGAGTVRWENVEGSFFRFRTLSNGDLLVDRETTLREDTLQAFHSALKTGAATEIDTRVYAVFDEAYARR